VSHARLLLATLCLVAAGCSAAAPPTGSIQCVGPSDGVLTLTAASTAFDAGCLALPAGEPTTIMLVNDDFQPHNLAIYTDSSRSTQLWAAGDIADAGETLDYQVPALEPGTYYFLCTIHPGMNGNVVVE